MDSVEREPFSGKISLEARFDAVLLGRLGNELARVYRDTMNAPLPLVLEGLIEQLETEIGQRTGQRSQGRGVIR